MTGKFSSFVSKGIEVNEYLQLNNHENIFVAGDVSNIVEEKTAQNAENHAKIVSNNIIAKINHKNMKKYKIKKRLMVISLGKSDGVVEYKNFVFTGILAPLVKKVIEKWTMFKFS
jgi:NADH dehydrogenase FAD-containing subunit